MSYQIGGQVSMDALNLDTFFCPFLNLVRLGGLSIITPSSTLIESGYPEKSNTTNLFIQSKFFHQIPLRVVNGKVCRNIVLRGVILTFLSSVSGG